MNALSLQNSVLAVEGNPDKADFLVQPMEFAVITQKPPRQLMQRSQTMRPTQALGSQSLLTNKRPNLSFGIS